MLHGNRTSGGCDHAEVHRFAEILRKYLDTRDITVAVAARLLRISERNIKYLLTGASLPNGSTLALIEHEIARGAGCTPGEVVAAVSADRAARADALSTSNDYATPHGRMVKRPKGKPEATGRGRK